MRAIAFDLIRKSAETASARLQFCRLAFGAAGSAGASIDTGEAEKVVRGLFADEKTQLEWNAPRALSAQERGQADPQSLPDRRGRHPARRRHHGDGAGGGGPSGDGLRQRRGERARTRRLAGHTPRCSRAPGASFGRRARHPALLYGPRRQGGQHDAACHRRARLRSRIEALPALALARTETASAVT